MFPSLAALGGTLGLLGLREPDLVGSALVGNLNQGYQRHIDSCPVDYAALMRDPRTGLPSGPIAKLAGDPLTANVALVGGGIANIIAAFELSRIGIRCTVFEAGDRLGGRLSSYRTPSLKAWSELGANRFPRGGLMWHYVAQWVRAAGFSPEKDEISAGTFPSPGTVPTMLGYQGEAYDWGPGPEELPPIVREARALFADFIAGLNDGAAEPQTMYFADAVAMLKEKPDDTTTWRLKGFWDLMLQQYDGRSFAGVLETEVFATGSNPPDLMAVFGTLGVGTGGFGHLYDAAFLEVLRVLLWDVSEEFMLPEEDTYPELFGYEEGGTWGFAMALARAAVDEARAFFPGLEFGDMFKLSSTVVRITSEGHGTPGVVVEVEAPGTGMIADYVIVGATTRAMQSLQLDLPYPGNPLLTPLPDMSTDLVRPSCRAAIKRLDVVSGSRMTTQLMSPRIYGPWPTDGEGRKILCFVTDERARLAYVLKEVPALGGLVRLTAADTYGADADKLRPLMPWMRQDAVVASFSYGLNDYGGGGDGAAKPMADLLKRSEAVDSDFGAIFGVQGAFKVDKPGDDYFSSSLFYHYQLAHARNELQGTDVFLSGDSVGHLGGWVEGAAMSAINAVVGVCSRMGERFDHYVVVADRFAALLENDVRLFHRWEDISGRSPSKAGLSSMVRLGNWSGDPALPARCRYRGITTGQAFTKITVSKSGDFAVVVIDDQLWFKPPGASWADLYRIPGTAGFTNVQSISVATEKQNPEAQLLVVNGDGKLWHATFQAGVWSEFRRPWANLTLKQAALDLEGGNAQVLVIDHSDRLGHGIRSVTREWSLLPQWLLSPSGDPWLFFVRDAAVSCTGLDQDLTTVAAIDRATGTVFVAIRDGHVPGWRPWTELSSPRPPDAEEPLRAVKVRAVVLDDENNAQVWAQFSDGTTTPARLYSSARDTSDPSDQTWTTFQPVPYPLSGAAGPIVDFAPTLPHGVLDPDLPHLSTVVYAQIGATLAADVPVPTLLGGQ